jgi:hypothetical protein
MKSILIPFVLLAMVVVSTPVASADSSPDRTRALITRTTDVVDRADRDRGDQEEATDDSTTNDDNEEEEGVVLDVSYNSDGHLEVNFNNGAGTGDVNITVVINGEAVSNTGSQTGGSAGGSRDGEDGADGRDGVADEEVDEDEPEEPEVVEEEESNSRYDSRGGRESFSSRR